MSNDTLWLLIMFGGITIFYVSRIAYKIYNTIFNGDKFDLDKTIKKK